MLSPAETLWQGERATAGDIYVKRGWTVKLKSVRLRARLKRFKNPEIDWTDSGWREDLNRMGPITLDRFHLPILFEVD